MNLSSSPHPPIQLNPLVKTAIIYSIENLFSYTVEIKEGNKSYFISNELGSSQFDNLETARQAAIKEGAKEAYLALSKTSEETDLHSKPHDSFENRFDYNKIPLD